MSVELAKEWLKAAEEDLLTIEEIKDNPNLTNVVAFHSQQCLEKSFKALLELHDKDVPKIHSTLRLYDMVREDLELHVDLDILTDLDDLYINGRYPSELGLMPSGKPPLEDAIMFYNYTRNIFERIKEFVFLKSVD